MHTERPTLTLTHHATLVRGERTDALERIEATLGIAFRSVADPDIAYLESDALAIDDVRTLSMRALQKPVVRDMMTFVIVADAINTEAQHALLKLTEDPPASARFIFILPHSALLLPTLRSRFSIVTLDDPSPETRTEEPLAKTLKEITRMAKDKDEAGMERLLRDAERHAHEKQNSRTANAVLLVRRYIESRGSSPKMLLEHLAIAERE